MFTTRTTRLTVAAVSLVLAGVAGPPGAAWAAGAPAAPSGTYVSVYTDQPPATPGAFIPTGSLPASVQTALNGGTVTPLTATPSGYKLRGGQPSTSYIYQSDPSKGFAILYYCSSSGCTDIAEARMWIKENVTGGTSKRWTMTVYAQRWTGSHTFEIGFFYECGVNISGATDSTCSTWRTDGADPSYTDLASFSGDYINRSFGTTNSVKKFPMIRMYLTWDTGTKMIGDDGATGLKFRGWDVCVTASTTKLCSTTGTG